MEIAAVEPERFALVRDGVPIALWCGRPRVQLLDPIGSTQRERRFYRLDYLERLPGDACAELGVLVLGAIALRTTELGVSGVIFGSFQERVAYYRDLGATQRKLRGWNLAKGLLPFVLEGDGLERLRRFADELRCEDEGA